MSQDKDGPRSKGDLKYTQVPSWLRQTPNLDDTQPIDYKRLAKEVVKEQNQQKANRHGCTCLVTIVVVAMVWAFLNADQFDQFVSTNPTTVPQVNTIPAQRVYSTQRSMPSARTSVSTVKPAPAQSYKFHVCTQQVVNTRKGAGYSDFAKAGELKPGRSYPVLDYVEGESVEGNTTWYLIADGGNTAFVTGRYTYACNETESNSEPTRVPAEQATISYITTCNDSDLLEKAKSSTQFRHNEVRRAIAFCVSKQVMVDLKVNRVFDTLDEAKREMYALLCALRTSDYGITFDVDSDFVDDYGNDIESRAILARFEADVVGRINCASYPGAVNWEFAAEDWWVHQALED